MQLLNILLFLFLGLVYINGEQAALSQTDTCDETPKTNTGRLKKKIFCGYDPTVRPVAHHSNQTSVKMAAFPINIGWMHEERNSIWMSFWLIMHWNDDLLSWNSSHYDGLEEFPTDGNMVWVPEIFVSDPPQSQISRQMSCVVRSTGYVDCSKNMGVTARCTIDLTYFPNDRHHCKVVFRPRTYKNNVLDLTFMDFEGTNLFTFYRSHGIWNLVSLKANRNVTKLFDDFYTIDMEYTFVIERRSSAYSATPLAVMMMMVLSVFWLEPQCSARIVLPGLTILCHMIILRWLMEVVSSNFESLPVIIVVVRNSMLLAGVGLGWSVVCRALCSCSFSPYWLYKATTNINNNQTIKLFLPHDIFIKSGTSGDEDESSLVVHRDCTEQQWRILIILSDRIFFSLYLLLYMYFFMSLTP
ncbi:neuronal acetylcholine receptor subunit alpha-7-like [Macrosteles quadrilineatus]|uniref:neuronal acetylcholine receptor subunit alpha-7-like n=1 Tax=Macrosteles quadrilineatus TaxID=74068 RepID=UPI0023E31B24|nr:neuronal acetylcholine receptor subunit alpha-7-like [Macrosteles quadrilineatus]XP_054278575.1 neuronal acetylcholine receptor subunit alpha-7-like [Macrosteles quadrilineatus]